MPQPPTTARNNQTLYVIATSIKKYPTINWAMNRRVFLRWEMAWNVLREETIIHAINELFINSMNLFFETQNPKSVCSLFSVTCVAWRFCRAGCTSSQAAKFAREACEIEWCPISLRFLCPRPPLLLSAPNQNCHATQATPAWKKSLSGLALTSSVINYTYQRFWSICVTFFVLFWLAYIF